jgi:hypothetical protein
MVADSKPAHRTVDKFLEPLATERKFRYPFGAQVPVTILGEQDDNLRSAADLPDDSGRNQDPESSGTMLPMQDTFVTGALLGSTRGLRRALRRWNAQVQ